MYEQVYELNKYVSVFYKNVFERCSYHNVTEQNVYGHKTWKYETKHTSVQNGSITGCTGTKNV